MGRDNNNAGLHMIWHNGYGKYEDLSRYDMMVQGRFSSSERNNSSQSQSKKQTDNDMQSRFYELYADLIPFKNWYVSDSIFTNMILIAVKNKKNLNEILSKCKSLIEKDKLNDVFHPTSFDKTFVFISLVADCLECSVADFFQKINLETVKHFTFYI